MASPRSAVENGSGDGVDAVSDAFELVAQGMAQLQVALRQQKQEAERKVQEALHLHKQEAERKVQEAENSMQEALRLQEERATTALREVERKLQEKDDAIRVLQQRLEETQGRVTAVEERRTAPEECAGEGSMQRLEGRVNEVEAALQRAVQKFLPRVEVLLRQLEVPQSARASLATATSAREAPVTRGAALGGGGEPLSSSSTLTPSGAGHQGAAADEEDRARRRVELRVREANFKMEEARTSPSPLGEQLCEAAGRGKLSDVRRLIDSGADVNYTDRNGLTPLLHAAWKLNADMVWLLLRRGANAFAVSGDCGNSALHLATTDVTGGCVYLLFSAGNEANARNVDGDTPLHRAAYYNNERTVRALLAAGARRDLRPWGGCWKNKTPLDLAMSRAVQDLLRG